MFKYLVGLVALIVAACAAFFSVQGLATLYAGQFLAVCVMASSLEVGKLVAASYLHRFWNITSRLLKTYLVCAVLILMGITSLGIFGFLTSAYEANYSKVELVQSKEDTINTKKDFVEKEITSLNQRIATLNLARTEQEKRLPGLSSKAAKPIYDDIARSGEEMSHLRNRIDELSNQLLTSNDQIIELKTEKKSVGDIGTLQFVANSFNVSIETIVKWFTLAIVLVFDPLAVSLVLAYNNLNPHKKERFIDTVLPELEREIHEELEKSKPDIAFKKEIVNKEVPIINKEDSTETVKMEETFDETESAKKLLNNTIQYDRLNAKYRAYID
jgi:hypothetical protein